ETLDALTGTASAAGALCGPAAFCSLRYNSGAGGAACRQDGDRLRRQDSLPGSRQRPGGDSAADRKSTRLNSSHVEISYAVFCLNQPATTQIYTLSLHDALPI